MPGSEFADAALVILGHGSTKNADSAAPVFQHAAELRHRALFAEVAEAFWKQEPRIGSVLSRIESKRVFIVPLFISEGYFSGQVIPHELGFGTQNPKLKMEDSRILHYCKPVGTHESMTNVLLARARDVVTRFPFPRSPKPRDISLFIAGHGTEQNEDSRKAIERQVDLIRSQQEYGQVFSVFLEEAPRIRECYSLAASRNIVVIPFFMSDGMHTREDIPVLLGEPKRSVEERLRAGQPTWRNPTERNGKLVWYATAVGTEPLIANVILERARETSNGFRAGR